MPDNFEQNRRVLHQALLKEYGDIPVDFEKFNAGLNDPKNLEAAHKAAISAYDDIPTDFEQFKAGLGLGDSQSSEPRENKSFYRPDPTTGMYRAAPSSTKVAGVPGDSSQMIPHDLPGNPIGQGIENVVNAPIEGVKRITEGAIDLTKVVTNDMVTSPFDVAQGKVSKDPLAVAGDLVNTGPGRRGIAKMLAGTAGTALSVLPELAAVTAITPSIEASVKEPLGLVGAEKLAPHIAGILGATKFGAKVMAGVAASDFLATATPEVAKAVYPESQKLPEIEAKLKAGKPVSKDEQDILENVSLASELAGHVGFFGGMYGAALIGRWKNSEAGKAFMWRYRKTGVVTPEDAQMIARMLPEHATPESAFQAAHDAWYSGENKPSSINFSAGEGSDLRGAPVKKNDVREMLVRGLLPEHVDANFVVDAEGRVVRQRSEAEVRQIGELKLERDRLQSLLLGADEKTRGDLQAKLDAVKSQLISTGYTDGVNLEKFKQLEERNTLKSEAGMSEAGDGTNRASNVNFSVATTPGAKTATGIGADRLAPVKRVIEHDIADVFAGKTMNVPRLRDVLDFASAKGPEYFNDVLKILFEEANRRDMTTEFSQAMIKAAESRMPRSKPPAETVEAEVVDPKLLTAPKAPDAEKSSQSVVPDAPSPGEPNTPDNRLNGPTIDDPNRRPKPLEEMTDEEVTAYFTQSMEMRRQKAMRDSQANPLHDQAVSVIGEAGGRYDGVTAGGRFSVTDPVTMHTGSVDAENLTVEGVKTELARLRALDKPADAKPTESQHIPPVDDILEIMSNEEGRSGGTLIGPDGKYESAEMARAVAEEIHNVLGALGERIPVYRAVSADNVDLSPYGIGESWSFDLEAAKEFGRHANGNKIIKGVVSREDVDWDQSIRSYHHNSGLGDAESEFELVIPSGNKIDNLSVENLKSATPIVLDDKSKKAPAKSTEESIASEKSAGDIIRRYEEDGDGTINDVVDKIEALDDPRYADAVNKYREQEAYNRELKGRNDMDAAEEDFLASVRKIAGSSEKPGSAIKSDKPKTVVDRITSPSLNDALPLPKEPLTITNVDGAVKSLTGLGINESIVRSNVGRLLGQGVKRSAEEVIAVLANIAALHYQRTRPQEYLKMIRENDAGGGGHSSVAIQSLRAMAVEMYHALQKNRNALMIGVGLGIANAAKKYAEDDDATDKQIALAATLGLMSGFATTTKIDKSLAYRKMADVVGFVKRNFTWNALGYEFKSQSMIRDFAAEARLQSYEKNIRDVNRWAVQTIKDNPAKYRLAKDYMEGRGTMPAGLSPDEQAMISEARRNADALSQLLVHNGIPTAIVQRTITANLGKYLPRSYQIHGDANFVPGQLALQNAVAGIKAEYAAKGMTISDQDALTYLDTLWSSIISDQKNNKFNQGSTGVPQGMFMKRADMPKWFRDFLGENENFGLAYAKHVYNASQAIENNQFLAWVRDKKTASGEKEWVHEPVNGGPPPGVRDLVLMPENARWGPLSGKYVRRDIAESIRGTYGDPRLTDKLSEMFRAALSPFKATVTIFNLPTHVVNVTGDVAMAMVNGAYSPFADVSAQMEAVRTVLNPQSNPAKALEYTKMLGAHGYAKLELSGLKESIAKNKFDMGGVTDALWNAKFEAKNGQAGQATLDAAKVIWRGATKAYDIPDQILKVSTYESFRRRGIPMDVAARMTHKLTPYYTFVPNGFKVFANLPFVPASRFLSFQTEMARIAKNVFTDPEIQKHAPDLKYRYVGMVAMIAGAGWALSKAAGIDYTEFIADMDKHGDDFQKGRWLVPVKVKEGPSGKEYDYVDMAKYFPQLIPIAPVYGAVRTQSAVPLVGMFTNERDYVMTVANVVMKAFSGEEAKDPFDNVLFNKYSSTSDKMMGVLQTVFTPLPQYKSIREMNLAFQGKEVNRWGDIQPPGMAIARAVGFGTSKYFPERKKYAQQVGISSEFSRLYGEYRNKLAYALAREDREEVANLTTDYYNKFVSLDKDLAEVGRVIGIVGERLKVMQGVQSTEESLYNLAETAKRNPQELLVDAKMSIQRAEEQTKKDILVKQFMSGNKADMTNAAKEWVKMGGEPTALVSSVIDEKLKGHFDSSKRAAVVDVIIAMDSGDPALLTLSMQKAFALGMTISDIRLAKRVIAQKGTAKELQP